MHRRWVTICASLGLATAALVATAGTVAASAASTGVSAQKASVSVMPNPVSMMDCNGHSTKYRDVKQDLGGGCTDPLGYWDGSAWRFSDNGSYVGHDEPSVKFISNAPGSGNNMTYVMQLSTDPVAAPTVPSHGKAVSDYAELSPAPWFGLPICDPNSYRRTPAPRTATPTAGR